MVRQDSRNLLFLAILVLGVSTSRAAIEYRMWQFHTMKPDYIVRVMEQAAEYGINSVVFSHEMNYFLSDFDDRGSELSQQHIKLAQKAHQLGLKVYVWPHELHKVPQAFIKNGVVQMDKAGFFEQITEKYNTFFEAYPEFDGIVLTFHETQYKIFSDEFVNTVLTKPQRFASLINAINKACLNHHRVFVARSFVYEPQELQWFAESLKDVNPSVILQMKCEPHDWQPFYPHDPLIGKFPDRKIIVEFDGSSEFTGRNRIPYTCPDYFRHRWSYGMQFPEVSGFNVRLDHAGFDAFFTPNHINLYTLSRLSDDPNLTANDIWKEWTVKRYGQKAAPFVEKALRPTFDSVNKAFFAKTFWYTNHSALPGGSMPAVL